MRCSGGIRRAGAGALVLLVWLSASVAVAQGRGRDPSVTTARTHGPDSSLAVGQRYGADLSAADAKGNGIVPSDGHEGRLRVGLALSGGGVKGFAHVGAMKVIDALGLPVDVVTGTSMGSFIGGLYAVGYSVQQIDSLVRTEEWGLLFEEESPRRQQPLEYRLVEEGLLFSLPVRGGQVRLPRGLVAGHHISQLLSRLFFPAYDVRDFRLLPTPFGAVAADLSNGEGVLLTTGHIADVIRASISIPSVFDPVVIDGRTLIDGGVTRNLPAEDARSLGADAVICIDVGEPVLPVDSLTSFVDVMLQAVGFRMLESNVRQRDFCDVLIAPDVHGVRAFDFDRTEEMIDRGEEAAHGIEGTLLALRDSLLGGEQPVTPPRRPLLAHHDSVFVSDLRIEGVSQPDERIVRRALRPLLSSYLSSEQLQNAVSAVYDTQRFARISYRLEVAAERATRSSGATLVLSAVERKGDRLSLGLRYDTDYQAAILMRATFKDVLGYGTRLIASLRLGQLVRVGASLSTPMGLGARTRLLADAEFRRTPIDLFAGGRRTSNLAAHVFSASLRAGRFLGPHALVTVGVRSELFDVNPRIAGSPGVTFDFLNETSGLVLGEVLFHVDTFDRTSFAGAGTKVTTRSTVSFGPLSKNTFGQHWIDAEGRLPLTSRVSLSGRAMAGRTVGSTIPVHYRFYAGGAFPFEILAGRYFPLMGYELHEVAGPNLRAVWAGLQVGLRDDLFVGAIWNAGSARADWTPRIDPSDFFGGAGISAGIRTVAGPIIVVVSAADLDGPYELHISVGHVF